MRASLMCGAVNILLIPFAFRFVIVLFTLAQVTPNRPMDFVAPVHLSVIV